MKKYNDRNFKFQIDKHTFNDIVFYKNELGAFEKIDFSCGRRHSTHQTCAYEGGRRHARQKIFRGVLAKFLFRKVSEFSKMYIKSVKNGPRNLETCFLDVFLRSLYDISKIAVYFIKTILIKNIFNHIFRREDRRFCLPGGRLYPYSLCVYIWRECINNA